MFSHSWLATVQEVLQADWQDVWHSPQPFSAVTLSVGWAMVFTCFSSFMGPSCVGIVSQPKGLTRWLDYSILPNLSMKNAALLNCKAGFPVV
jgi:hypothetical protein